MTPAMRARDSQAPAAPPRKFARHSTSQPTGATSKPTRQPTSTRSSTRCAPSLGVWAARPNHREPLSQQAAARARRAKPGAKRRPSASEANAAPGTLLTRVRVIPGLRVGVGDSVGAVGRCNQAVPRDPPRTRLPNTRGSTSRRSPALAKQRRPQPRAQRQPGRSDLTPLE